MDWSFDLRVSDTDILGHPTSRYCANDSTKLTINIWDVGCLDIQLNQLTIVNWFSS